jgi:hypothetical protein
VSNYKDTAYTDPVILNHGLDFSSAKVTAQPGSLYSSYNFEITDKVGYSRVEGFERYDGGYSPSYAQDGTVITLRTNRNFSPAPSNGDFVTYNGVQYGRVVGTFLSGEGIRDIYIVRFSNAQLSVGNFVLQPSAQLFSAAVISAPPADPSNNSPRATDNIIALNNVYSGIRSEITSLPNARIAHGLHWFKDRLYAVVDDLKIPFSNGTDEVFVGEEIEWETSGYTAIVRDVEVTDGTWTNEDPAEGFLVVQAVLNTTAPDTVSYASVWASQDVTINRDTPVAGALTIGASTALQAASGASLWRTDNELLIDQGKMEPDNLNYGWNPVDMGIEFGFEDGTYFFDRFPMLNRTNADNEDFTGAVQDTGIGSTDSGPQYAVRPIANVDSDGNPFNVNAYFSPVAPGSTQFVLPSSASPTTAPLPTTWTDFDNISKWQQTGDNQGLVIECGPLPAGWTSAKGAARFYVNDFINSAVIPDKAAISGFEVSVRVFETRGGADNAPDLTRVTTGIMLRREDGTVYSPETQGSTIPVTANSYANATEIVLGGPSYKFGIEDQLYGEQVKGGSLWVPIDLYVNTYSSSSGVNIERDWTIDYVKVVIYYTVPGSKIFFWNGVDDVEADIVGQWVRDGSLLTANGAGVLQVYNIKPYDTDTRTYISLGDEIRSSPNGGGNLLGKVSDYIKGSSLAPLSAILEKESRYQMITANFYARDDWDAFYGVSGASRGFVYDGQFFRNLFTGLTTELDIPRHIAYHHGHLALGYSAGVLNISVQGQPENFYEAGWFIEVGFGDAITGLLPMNGTTLGVFCQGSIHALIGTNVDDFNTSVLSPDEGAIEYTVVDAGQPTWCSYNGISNYQQTSEYGNFRGFRLSSVVHPWLLRRLTKNKGIYGGRGVDSLVCAIVCHAKSQYHLFFEDGYVLTMTQTAEGPKFTIRQYYVGTPPNYDDPAPDPANLNIVVPIAHSVAVDSFGENRMHISHYSRYYPNTNSTSALKYVFELDKGWSFDGSVIVANFQINWMFLGQPLERKTLKSARLFGQSYGYGEYRVFQGRDFLPPDDNWVNCSLPKNANRVEFDNDSDNALSYDLVPYSSEAELAKTGMNLCLKYASSAPLNNVSGLRIQPPALLQAILIQTKDGV